ncbi:putative defensin-like protein 257 [Eutrema salsugineum]|uniref:putative defensin-like protein 257 n=1 Tax=Eutrema salsugineum TaxID=72664 RepID=UPI000CED56AD|nr:putative defensin-like protein 257 [Eutrema salsugineum]
MKNVSLKLPLLIFILVITSNLGAEAREPSRVEVIAESSNNAVTAGAMDPAHPPCKRDVDCSFECPKGGLCNDRLGTCDCF